MDAAGSFDVIVIGGGSAGCVAAGRLAERGDLRVALIEAGPDYGPAGSGRWPGAFLDADAVPTDHDWGYPEPSSSRARLLGGCSAHNGCEEMWGARADYDEWGAVDPSLGFAAMEPRLREVERRLQVRETREEDLLPMRRALLDAAIEAGYPRLPRSNDPPGPAGVAMTTMNASGTHGTTRWNAAFAYLDPVRESGRLTILAEALVDRVVVERGRAVGVAMGTLGTAGSRVVHAPVVVLAAGAYGSPGILLRSGIGDASMLRALGIPVVADVPAVGAGLIDHPFVHVTWERSSRLQALDEEAARDRRPTAQAVLRWASSRCDPGTWDLTAGAWSGAAPLANDDARGVPAGRAGFSPCAMKPRSRGRVTITTSDPTVLPHVEHGFLTDPTGEDVAVLVDGVRECLGLAGTATMRRLLGGPLDVRPTDGDVTISRWIRANVAGTFHPMGTCRIGTTDNPRAVADPRGRVRGADGLWVVDASAMPTMPRANVHISVLGLAEALVEGIAVH